MLPQTVTVRPLTVTDIPDADRIFRLAFGTWLKLPDPLRFAGDSSWIATRVRGQLGGAHAAAVGDRLIGSNFTANRGSVAYFGPLTVDPEWWGKGVAQVLVSAAVDDFTRWGTSYAGLYTFADSVLHISLYRKFGFWPGHLTGILVKELSTAPPQVEVASFAAADVQGRATLERHADAICAAVRDGLTVVPELRSVALQQLGDTVFLPDGAESTAFAVCHCGSGSEAGTGVCRIKFAAATSARAFDRIVQGFEALAWSRGATQVQVGVNFGRERACRALLERGYRAIRHGVAMYRPNDPAYDRVDAFVVDDWR